ncbi:possible integrase [Rhodococcus jostii RHA1]|uniref:Possible integrase n=1 Tax=Rhodococcus jostii (strain RHA1) TaxID=101510 RepID=Q0S2A9_RHOJR|nr:recombinase family protein [Rhodococcus jostii]ABG98327.1 possible integrase [Rhodococcus jostii RHA1]
MDPQHKPTRALIVIRLSRLTDETTSPERQLEACERFCAARGWEVVGVAEDLDVSAGTTSPFERPSLSQWIGDGKDNPGRIGEFDTVVFYRVDRLVRRVRHLHDVIAWSERFDVNMVSATESHFDLSTTIGALIAQLVASFAEMELEGISQRATSAHRHNVQLGKFVGGSPPFGYMPEETPDGWRLVHDPDVVPIILEVVDRVLEGEPLRRITDDLNARGATTARDLVKQRKGKETEGHKWHSNVLKRRLMSPAMLGYALRREPLTDSKGKPKLSAKGAKLYGPEEIVRGPDGLPVQRAEPILPKPLFDRVVAELEARELQKEPTKRINSMLLRVLYCGVCGQPVYRAKGQGGRSDRYRCRSIQDGANCGNPSVLTYELDDLVEESILVLMGDSERLAHVWNPGEDNASELAEVEARLADRTGLIGVGAYKAGTPQRATLDTLIEADAKLYERLKAATPRPAGWTWEPTGETFAEWWAALDTGARNVYLRNMGVRVTYDKRPVPEQVSAGEKPRVHLELGEVRKMAEQVAVTGTIGTLTRNYTRLGEIGITHVDIDAGSGKAVFVTKSGERFELPLNIPEE